MAGGLCSISVDLDSLQHYCRIYGLPEQMLDDDARRLVYDRAVPRFVELFDRFSMPGTFFAIGEDLADRRCAASLKSAQRSGIEIGSHSFSHDYGLAHRAADDIEADLQRADVAIEAAVGQAPCGFRAPGYTLTPALYQAVCNRNYQYDSSTFPAVPYYAAKASVMGALALLGRPSSSVLDSPKVLFAPREAYHPDPAAPYRRGNGAALELPIATAPFSRLPFIGLLVLGSPLPFVRAVYRTIRGSPHLNFELHGVDVLDGSDGIPERLTRQQRDLRVASSEKMSRLSAVLSWIRDDFEVVTLAEAARRIAGRLI